MSIIVRWVILSYRYVTTIKCFKINNWGNIVHVGVESMGKLYSVQFFSIPKVDLKTKALDLVSGEHGTARVLGY